MSEMPELPTPTPDDASLPQPDASQSKITESTNTIADLATLRARKARLAKHIGKSGYNIIRLVGLLLLLAAIYGFTLASDRIGYIALALAIASYLLASWYNMDLAKLPADGPLLNQRLSGDILNRLKRKKSQTPRSVWHAISRHWQVSFMMNHLLLARDTIENMLPDNASDMDIIWDKSVAIADSLNSPLVEPIHVATALMASSPDVQNLLVHLKLSSDDLASVASWLGRELIEMNQPKPYFGGIGRDWASGFTPRLSTFGHNISETIERTGSHFGWLTSSKSVTSIADALEQNTGSIALIGPSGIGKTSSIYALAQLVLQEAKRSNIAHRQIIELNSSHIISSAQRPGDLEHIVTSLLGEAVHAGNIILFFDDAQLFFSSGPGSFDASQILLPIAQGKAVQMIFALSPNDYQLLRSHNPAFAGLITPVIMQELGEADTMRVLEDTALGLEHRQKALVSYEALKEAYRLSGRYDQETAYPGKAIQLLQQSMTHGKNHVITAESVQDAIEQTRGVKASAARPSEASDLLNLEDTIHKRMINQTHAVSVVASALRRARAGVSNPKRPIGSFMFLGPTGVGKTELAKSIAVTYFRDEANMIRLDMSEYQQASDVARLLASGEHESSSLILKVRAAPFSVVLLDEIEKAHPNILNLLLQLLDEGQLTDASGRPASFKDCIIICTSNAGADEIRHHIEAGEKLEDFEQQFTDNLINSGQFKPELLNRFDEIVLFRPLNESELLQVVGLMLVEVNQNLATQNISVNLTEAAAKIIVKEGNDPRLGARPMRRMVQKKVEDLVASKILRGELQAGSQLTIDDKDLDHS